ncbi:hypothetical protein [Robertmurraya sp. FSL R5-0851]|uniref:hypothetical protein n=1 Tax=Robertmurraya sp. FSL R5-0851 TaxID=2921584 RepID=UPI0030F605FE
MNSKLIWSLVIIFIIAGVSVYLFISPSLGKQSIDLVEAKSEVLTEVEEYKEYANNTTEWIEKNGVEAEIGFFTPSEEDHNHHSDPKEDVIKYFIAGLLDNNIDIFLSSFYPDSISKDLFEHKNPDKFAVTEEIMQRLSRKGTLKAVDYKVNKGFMDQETNSITLTITYRDKKKADIILELMTVEDIHHEGEVHQMYVITNSVWDMIDHIENSTS